MTKDFINVGKIGKTHGTKGHISIHLTKELDWDNLNVLFIEINNTPIPYIIEEIHFLSKKIIVKFQLISSIEEAKKMTNKNIFVSKEFILKQDGENYINFSVIDVNENNTPIGKVIDWIEQEHLKWLVVKTIHNKEILLPFNDNLIESIDPSNQTIMYKAVKGMY